MVLIKLTAEEYKKLNESLKVLEEMFKDQLQTFPKEKASKIDNEFVKTIGEKYITPTGLLDLLEDYGMLTKGETCPCSAPCTATCVSPCASRCNASTYSDFHP